MNALLHDQRFWAGLVGLIVIVVSSLHPDLEDNLNHIAPAVVGIIGTMFTTSPSNFLFDNGRGFRYTCFID